MLVPLMDLKPTWVDKGLGLQFLCPCDHDHRVTVWFSNPLDDAGSVTLNEDRQALFYRDGEDFTEMGLYPPIVHGDCWIVVYQGSVNILYV